MVERYRAANARDVLDKRVYRGKASALHLGFGGHHAGLKEQHGHHLHLFGGVGVVLKKGDDLFGRHGLEEGEVALEEGHKGDLQLGVHLLVLLVTAGVYDAVERQKEVLH